MRSTRFVSNNMCFCSALSTLMMMQSRITRSVNLVSEMEMWIILYFAISTILIKAFNLTDRVNAPLPNVKSSDRSINRVAITRALTAQFTTLTKNVKTKSLENIYLNMKLSFSTDAYFFPTRLFMFPDKCATCNNFILV